MALLSGFKEFSFSRQEFLKLNHRYKINRYWVTNIRVTIPCRYDQWCKVDRQLCFMTCQALHDDEKQG